jgi:2-oxoacid:acceptor oxidoreductase delta subunit (pyruvate/2-ketoisovalerate family)
MGRKKKIHVTKELTYEFAASPGSSLANKTGSWRSTHPVVNRKVCIGCKLCQMYCPDSCIKIINRKSVIDLDYCKGCSVCAAECPVKAISMEQEEK